METQGEVSVTSGEHGRSLPFRGIEGVGNNIGCVLGDPLVRAGWAFRELPFVAEEVVEVVVGPLRARLSPRDFQSAGYSSPRLDVT